MCAPLRAPATDRPLVTDATEGRHRRQVAARARAQPEGAKPHRRTHNFFLETGARQNKLKVYEMVEHPAARALTGSLLVRGGVHQVAYARAVERLTGADLTKIFPVPRVPTEKIPECQPHLEAGLHLKLYRFSPERLPGAEGRVHGSPSGDG